jgi:hypothetical protein
VFIVVYNNTGWDRPNDDGEMVICHQGNLALFRNYDENGSG